jgi:two-component system alkaline phosphatase synthesis response regulator PhoP
MPLIYCVEDDESIRELVAYTLENTGFTARGFSDGPAFEQVLSEEKPDLILLDIMLPGEDGVHILKRIRKNPATQDIPVIMVTAKGAEYDKVMALDGGADDYVTKPFGMMELVSRIKAVLRRTQKKEDQEPDRIEIGPIMMDTEKHVVELYGETLTLTLKEFNLLKMLMENSEVVLTRDQLLTDIWGYDFDGETRTVDVHIRTLRQKLGEAGNLIETVRGVGYRIHA